MLDFRGIIRNGSALTASARCRNWLAVIDGPLCRLRLRHPSRPLRTVLRFRRGGTDPIGDRIQSVEATTLLVHGPTLATRATVEVGAWEGAGRQAPAQ